MPPTPISPDRPGRRPHVPWREWEIGMRVSVRRRRAEGGFADALGYITEITDAGLEVETRRGKQWIDGETIFVGKRVPPPPPKRPRRQN